VPDREPGEFWESRKRGCQDKKLELLRKPSILTAGGFPKAMGKLFGGASYVKPEPL